MVSPVGDEFFDRGDRWSPFQSCYIRTLLMFPQTMYGTAPSTSRLSTFRPPTQLCKKIQPLKLPETGCRISVSLRTEISPSPYTKVLLSQNRFALCGFYVVQETTKAVQVLFFDTYLFSDLVCISSFHRCTA